MKSIISILAIFLCMYNVQAQTAVKQSSTTSKNKLYLDIHYIPGGSVKAEDVAKAHVKDLAIEKKYGVHFQKYWVDEAKGVVYCLSSAPDTASILKTHSEAHGLMPQMILDVTNDAIDLLKDNRSMLHYMRRLESNKNKTQDIQ